MQKTILILYTNGGYGHKSLAEGLKECIAEIDSNIEVILVDPFYRFVEKYLGFTSTKMKLLWEIPYRIFDSTSGTKFYKIINNVLFTRNIKRIVDEHEPFLIISNVYGASMVLTDLLKQGYKFQTIQQIADPFTIHHVWAASKDLDLHLVHGKKARESLIKMGVDQNKIIETGTSMRSIFLQDYSDEREKIGEYFGIDCSKKWIFIGGAGLGIDTMPAFLRQIKNNLTELQKNYVFIVNTGINTSAINETLEILYKSHGTILLLPKISNPAIFMKEAEMIIGKTGPNFMMEALMCEKPLFFIGTVPGQESGNLQYAIENRISRIYTPKELIDILLANKNVGINTKAYDEMNELNRNSKSIIKKTLKEYL